MLLAKTYKYSSFWGICLVLFFFGSPNIVLAIQNLLNGSFYTALLNLFHLLVTSGILLLPIVLFKLPVRRYFLVISPVFTLIPILIFLVVLYHQLPTRSIFYVMFELQKIDISEFLSGTLFWKALIVIIPFAVILISVTLIDSKLVLKNKIKLFYSAFYIFLFVFTISFKTIQRKTLHKAFQVSYRSFFRDTPIHTIKRLSKAFIAIKKKDEFKLSHDKLAVSRKLNDKIQEVYILVLGESSRYKNWGINGYHRNTSPLLNKQTNLISYNNIISPSYNTNKSIPLILTSQNVSNYYRNNSPISMIEIYNQAGFKTYWISGQASKGNIIGTLANNSDELYETNYHTPAGYDGKLLKKVEDILNRNEPKILLIIHTWGSHYPYQKRYPKEFEAFTPVIKKNKHIPTNKKHKEAIINSYDNSILYTDYFLSELIQLLDSDTTISFLSYLSDHGENLFDDDHIGFGRGYGKFTPELFHVPLFFWASKKYISNNYLKWEMLKNNKSIKSTTEEMIYTLTDIAGIKWNNTDSTLSFASRYFKESNRSIINNKETINYDAFFPEKNN